MTPYRAPWWLPGGNLQTIWSALRARGNRHRLRREVWTTPDDDVVVVDFVDGPPDAPFVVLFHGLEGGTESHYAQALVEALRERGWRGAIPHFRGCGGVANRQPRAYHSGDSAEIGWMIERLAGLARPGALFVSGVSLGGNALLKWLGEEGEGARSKVRAAAAISAPLDLAAAGAALEVGFERLYARMFLKTMKPKALAKLERFPALFDAERLRRARTLREFDDLVTAPLHGFSDYADYYRRSSAKPFLARIRVPTLVINARNDPFLPGRHLPGPTDLSPAITAEFPETGGHVGFVSGPFPGRFRWLPDRIIAFFAATLASSGEGGGAAEDGKTRT